MCKKKNKRYRAAHIEITSVLSLTAAEGFSFAKTQSEKPSTCEGSRDVVLDLDVHKESRQSERHVTLTAQADMMETCGA